MNISRKIVIFFSLVCLFLFVFTSLIVSNRIESTKNIENQLVENNIKKVYHVLRNSSKYLSSIAYEYQNDEKVIELVKAKDEIALEKFVRSKNQFMKKLHLSYFILFDEKKKYLFGSSYDISSDEELSIPYELLAFFKHKKIDKFINNSNENFMTLSFEKTIFDIAKIQKNSKTIGYLFVARTIDSQLLNDMSELSQGYMSLVSYTKALDLNKLSYLDRTIEYGINRYSDSQMFSFIKLYDVLEDDAFFIRLQSSRNIFQELIHEVKFTLLVFVLLFITIVALFFIFINRVFTKRIAYITNEVKTASREESLLINLKIDYNDEIGYLSKKMNEMFHAMNAHQNMKLKRERDFLQSVLDTQQNIILITDGKNIESTNRKFNEIFDSKESFLSNIALLDNRTRANLVAVAKKYENQEKPAQFTVVNESKYFTFDVSRLDVKKYLICMNDVSNLNKKISHLEVKATIDELTAVYNKATIIDIANAWLSKREFGLIVFDIDHFKKINDKYGHYIGDCILKELCKVISREISKDDILGRFGGEEFIMLINDYNPNNLPVIANRLREIIEQHLFNFEEQNVKVTVSMGCTFCRRGEIFTEVFKIADSALYLAKEKGRNRVEYI